MSYLRGALLIATPSLLDPNFERTVVLIAEHNEEGAMGLVLNRPSEITIAQAAPELEGLAESDEAVYVGGPVQTSGIIVLAEFDQPELAGVLVEDDLGFVDGASDLIDVAAATRRARVFAGYTGWGPGQLESEIGREDWIVESSAERREIFTDAPAGLWSAVLERKGGQFALLARMPEDPSVN